MSIDVVITTYNGKNLLEKHLASVIRLTPKAKNIIVIDDASTDGTDEYIKTKFPHVIYHKNAKNLGFTISTNIGVKLSNADLVVLLNNDIHPQPHYLDSATKHFKDEDIFAVNFSEAQHSWPQVTWKDGKVSFVNGEDKTSSRYIAWGSGGSCVIRRSHWMKLGGFNPIYSPGYWEDIDMGWRAWKQGFKIIWDHQSHILHQHESTFNKLDPQFVSNLKQRNELLFIWKNITDKSLLLDHYKFLVTHTIKHPGYAKVVLSSLVRLLTASKGYSKYPNRLSDSQLLSSINTPLND